MAKLYVPSRGTAVTGSVKSITWLRATEPCEARPGPNGVGRLLYVTPVSLQELLSRACTVPPLLLMEEEVPSTWSRSTTWLTVCVPTPVTTKRR